MTIAQTTLLDRGEYSCVASNAYGHDHAGLNLQVQEPPNFPKNLHISELGSRSVILAWTMTDNLDSISNSNNMYVNTDSQPITNYILQFKDGEDVWNDHNNQKLLPGDKTTALVAQLRPATVYHFRIFAENHLGTSAPSDILQVLTDSEVPGGAPLSVTVEPLGPKQLLVTWRPPERDLWNGELLGYTIGFFKIITDSSGGAGSGGIGGSASTGASGGSVSPPLLNVEPLYNYTRVGIPGGGEGISDFRLVGLEKYTQYSVTVQAFNIKGDGPSSEPIITHTLEDVPSAPPQNINCIALSAQNIQVNWLALPRENAHGIIQGYKLL